MSSSPSFTSYYVCPRLLSLVVTSSIPPPFPYLYRLFLLSFLLSVPIVTPSSSLLGLSPIPYHHRRVFVSTIYEFFLCILQTPHNLSSFLSIGPDHAAGRCADSRLLLSIAPASCFYRTGSWLMVGPWVWAHGANG